MNGPCWAFAFESGPYYPNGIAGILYGMPNKLSLTGNGRLPPIYYRRYNRSYFDYKCDLESVSFVEKEAYDP